MGSDETMQKIGSSNQSERSGAQTIQDLKRIREIVEIQNPSLLDYLRNEWYRDRNIGKLIVDLLQFSISDIRKLIKFFVDARPRLIQATQIFNVANQAAA